MTSRCTLMIIVASVRQGRVGLPVAEWVRQEAEADGRFEVDFADLAQIALPLMDEPNHPRLRQYTREHTKEWSGRVDRADAFVFVMPEYNYGFNAPLKNALDYLNQEWAFKPVGLVSYGGVSAGTRAAQMIKQVITTLRMTPVFEAVPIPWVAQMVDDEGVFQATEVLRASARAMFAELERVERALHPLRPAPDS